MKKIFSVLTCLIVAISSYGQSNFIPGYIITNDNDTVRGLIDFRTDIINGSTCRFKVGENDAQQIFSPSEIKAYRFIDEGKFYVSERVNLNDSEKRVFLEYLIQGVVSLYYYEEPTDHEKNIYFFIRNEQDKIIPISKEKDKIENSNLITDIRYKGIVNYALNNPTTLSKDINNLLFERKSMIKVVKKYHAENCEPGEECIQFASNSKKSYVKVNFIPYIGMRVSNYKYSEINSEPTNHTYAEFGAQLAIGNHRYSKSFTIVLDVSISNIKEKDGKYRLDYTGYPLPVEVEKKFKYSATVVSGKLIGQYTYPNGIFRPSAGIGWGINRLFGKPETMAGSYITKIPAKSFTGFNFNVGFDYQTSNDNAIVFRVGYDLTSQASIGGEDKLRTFDVRLGYKF